jgi:hypothetical protein
MIISRFFISLKEFYADWFSPISIIFQYKPIRNILYDKKILNFDYICNENKYKNLIDDHRLFFLVFKIVVCQYMTYIEWW